MKIKKRQLKLRTALLTVLTVALLASAAAFLGANAAESVSPSDVSKSDVPKGIVTCHISQTDVSPSDDGTAKVTLWRRIAGFFAPLFTSEAPANLGAPAVTMVTGKGVGETLNIEELMGSNLYIDYGNGIAVPYEEGDGVIQGSNIKIYGNVTSLLCNDNNLTSLDVTNAPNLGGLCCNNNPLQRLDVTHNAALGVLACHNNQLTELDVSNNTQLTDLDCGNNQLTELVVTHNTALTSLRCNSNQLTELDVSHNTALLGLYCDDNRLTALNVENNTGLHWLHCNINQLTELDVSHNTELFWLYCGDNQLTGLNVENNTALFGLSCYDNRLTALNVSNKTALIELDCDNNQLTTLNVSNNTAMKELRCESNQMTTLNVAGMPDLKELQCSGNRLTALDVTSNPALVVLQCSGNQLTSLDVTHNAALEKLLCNDNQLATIDVSNNPSLTYLGCYDNQMKFSTLPVPGVGRTDNGWYGYAPQEPVTIPSFIEVGGTVNLSSEYSINGTVTQYVWYDGEDNAVTPTQSEGGVFTFGEEFEGQTLYCVMSNALFSDFVESEEEVNGEQIYCDQLTTNVTVGEVSPTLGDPAITMTTSKGEGETLNIEELSGSNLYIDYGNGIAVPYEEGDGVIKGSNIKIYGDVAWIWCNDNQLTALDVSNAPNLGGLYCGNNALQALDLSGNTALTYLDCRSNQLTSLNVSTNTALTELLCEENQLTSLDVSTNTALTYLQCNDNQLTTLEVSTNTALTELWCGENQLTALDVSGCTNLKNLSCEVNRLTSLDVSNNTALVDLFCFSNPLGKLNVKSNLDLEELGCEETQLITLDVSKNTKLVYLDCANNQLSTLDVSKNTKLEQLFCDNNQLTALDVSNNTALRSLCCERNQLTSLDLSHNPDVQALHCRMNRLPFATIYSADPENKDWAFYAPQTHVIPSTVKAGESLDLSSEYSVDGTVTQFIWYDSEGNTIVPATSDGGVFTFGDDAVGKTLICKMTNTRLPDFGAEADVAVGWDEETAEIIYEKRDTRLITTQVTVQAATATPGDDTSSKPDNSTPSNTSDDADDEVRIYEYFPLELDQLEGIDEFEEVKCHDDTTFTVDGRWVIPSNVRLVVGNIQTNKKKTVLDAIKRYNAAFDTESTDMALYDISLLDKKDAHVKVQNGRVWICLKYPDNLARQSEDYTFHIYHQKENGTVEEVPIICKPDGIWFGAKEFSPYVLYWYVPSSGSANTGESSVLIWVMAGLCVLSLAAAGAVVYRKRKNTAE